ncbi:hypothetical protein DPMN_153693 [Dreissena polymorpha]|uniref:Uncharacterized protein n=1 Tax=Dreissena polymorpha TaxID=45954 RepID=A0A9D4FMT8_DREPO|nr:hypothetical protein DPMN_153693 [Dreissena polymorpha]
MCCEVLQKLLSPLPPDVILTQFHDELLTGLQHDELPVRKLCLSQVTDMFNPLHAGKFVIC